MKQAEMTRSVKEELWRLFKAGHEVSRLTIGGRLVPIEAIEKQHHLWQEYTKRRTRRTNDHVEELRTEASQIS